tara:strand:+ start:5769 stop:6266 length:498 start_codon:yes stop_codon:yes gene_type:complete
MKLYTLFTILFILFIFTSCKKSKEDFNSEKVYQVIMEYHLNKKQTTDTITLTIIPKNDSINYHIFSHGIPFEINPSDNSKITIWETPTDLVDKKEYNLNGKKLMIKKYYYDVENSSDEEGYYFLLNNRIIAFRSEAWVSLYDFYKYDKTEVHKLLEKDSTDFFYN